MAAWGRYGQQPQPGDLSASFGNPTLPAATAVHRVVGAGLRPIDPLHIDLVGFSTEAQGIATRSTAEQPARAEALLPIQEARSYGAQLMARLDPTRGLYGWLSSTLAWAERRVEGGEWRPSDYDQRLVLTALGGAELPWGLNAGLRARVASGLPRTEVVGAIYDPRRDLYQPVFGPQNELRLPTFFSADLRLAKTWTGEDSTVELSLEVQNLTNRDNTEELLYAVDYTARGQISGMPLLPVLGLRWSF
jgi:outer membrane receptor protein involved in Fe transport